MLLSGWGNLLSDNEKVSDDVDIVLSKPPKINELRQALKIVLSIPAADLG
jgi:hypothetical protein